MSVSFQIQRKIRDSVIKNLRRIFTNDPKYPYIELPGGEYDFDNTKIVISDVIPQEHAFFPAIVVDTVSGPESRYIGPDDLGETKVANSNTVTGDLVFSSINSTVNINVYTMDDTITRDEVIDRIYDHFKLLTDDLADDGIEIKRTIFNADRRTFVLNRWALVGGISLEVYSEWQDDLGVGDTIATIPINLTIGP